MTDLELADEAAKNLGRLYAKLHIASIVVHPTSDNERITVIHPNIDREYLVALLERAIVALQDYPITPTVMH